MAMASSSARRKAPTNSGTSSGTMAFARWSRLPVSKSAPRAVCAFMILSVSSRSVGMKRRAMVIIMAISCTGKCTAFRGLSSRSSASVSAMGEVVSVKSDVPASRNTSLRLMNTANRTPSQ